MIELWNEGYQTPKGYMMDDELINAALDAACRKIQEALGVNGDVAGLHFSGDAGERFRELMRDYIRTERAYSRA